MSAKILVLHGPSLNLLGDPLGAGGPGQTLDALNHLLHARAEALGLELKIVQSNHEGALVDALQAERRWADGVLVSPAALAWSGHVLADALRRVALPAIEVHLEALVRPEGWTRGSVLEKVCLAQESGGGAEAYLRALEQLASREAKRSSTRAGSPAKQLGRKVVERALDQAKARQPAVDAEAAFEGEGEDESEGPAGDEGGEEGGAAVRRPAQKAGSGKTLGRGRSGEEPGPAAPKSAQAGKTLGRARPEAAPADAKSAQGGKTLGRAQPASPSAASRYLSRAQVRQKISERLAGSLKPSDLVTWARQQYLEVQRGAPAESGQRELLESSLQLLLLSSHPASRLSDEQLLDLMTQLDG